MQFHSMDQHTSDTRLKGLRLSFALAACTAALVACGGGGDGGDPNPPPPPVLVDPAVAMRGFWSGAVTSGPDAATRASAVVMPDGTSWVVLESNTAATGVAKIPLTGTAVNATDANFTGSGAYYRLVDGLRSTVTTTGTASTAGTFRGTATVTGKAATAYNWTPTAGFTTAAVQSAATGTWNGTAGTGVLTLSWGISATGAVTGTSSTGCSYTGTVVPAAGTAVYNVNVSEDCQGTVKTLAGIATLAANRTALRVVFTADAGASAGLFSLTKQ